MKFKIYRYSKEKKEEGFADYEFETREGMTVLLALFHIQDRFDDSLSFRYSCRGAVCGNCAMLINKVPRLACRTQISKLSDEIDDISLKPFPALENSIAWNPKDTVLIEPLPHLPIIKDLVVNMDKFFKYYRAVEPVFNPGEDEPELERLMDRDKVLELEKYTNCILCASCVGSCPVNSENEKYFGPAALAKLYRFYIDPREQSANKRLELGNSGNGWWGCKFHTNCNKVCPKGVPPNIAIGRARQALKKLENVPSEQSENK